MASQATRVKFSTPFTERVSKRCHVNVSLAPGRVAEVCSAVSRAGIARVTSRRVEPAVPSTLNEIALLNHAPK
jgi:hypothetical protein